MDKDFLDNTFTTYYVTWTTTVTDDELDFSDVDWSQIFGGLPKTETPERAPVLDDIQNGI